MPIATPGATAPALGFVSHLGGLNEDTLRDVITDATGNIYVTGGTASPDFPVTAGAYDTTPNGSMDVFVAKLAPSGHPLWVTVLGGPNYDRAYALELDSQRNVIVAGRAGAAFPTTAGVVQPAFAGDTMPNALYGPQDGFIAKLSADGTTLLWATYWGTDDDCIIRDIAVDEADALYPAACIESGHHSQHLTPGAFQTAKPGMRDGLVAKLSPNASHVEWCTYLGGTANDAATPSIRVDATGVYFLASTFSTDAPTTPGAAARTSAGGTDMYVAKLAPDGATLLWATYLGGTMDEFSETHGLAVNAQHEVYVAATTSSADLSTSADVVQPLYGGTGAAGRGAGTNYPGDGFVARLSARGQLLAATYLGGSAGEGIEGVSIGADGTVYVSGATFSSNFPITPDALQPTYAGAGDLFAAHLSADLTTRLYATYLGGTAPDYGRSSTVDSTQNFILVGATQSATIPTVNGLQATPPHGWDGVVIEIAPAGFPTADD